MTVAVLTVLVVGASPASAHAELLSTEPSSGQVLDTSPSQVVLHFNERVQPPDDAIELFASSGDRIDVGDVTGSNGGADVSVSLPDIDDGAYVVTWRVTSADSHPVRGGFTFRVGAAGSDNQAEALMERLIAGEGGDTTVGVAYGVVRFVAFVGLVLLVGGAAFVLVLWPGGGADPRARQVLAVGWYATFVATILSFGLQAAYAAGKSFGSALDASLIADVFTTRAGEVWLLRLGLLAVVLALTPRLLPGPRAAAAGPGAGAGWSGFRARWSGTAVGDGPTESGTDTGRDLDARVRLLVAAGLGVGLLATISLAGHASTGDLVPVAFVADVVHLAAVSLWLGGLAMLTHAVLRPRPAVPDSERPDGSEDSQASDDLEAAADDSWLRSVVGSFSTLALIAVATIVVTGTIQAIRQVQSLGALTSTTYGKELIVKVATFVALLVVAAVSRDWVRRRWRPPGGSQPTEPVAEPVGAPTLGAGPGATAVAAPPAKPKPAPPPLSALRRSVAVETVVAAAVLAITALLVNTVPAAEEYAPTYTAELHSELLLVAVTVDPAKAGQTDITVETESHLGQPQPVQDLTATLTLASRDIGPIPMQLNADASQPGRYVADNVDIPLAGTWQLDITARVSEFDENTVTAEVPFH